MIDMLQRQAPVSLWWRSCVTHPDVHVFTARISGMYPKTALKPRLSRPTMDSNACVSAAQNWSF
jgi:hypothetical protein